MGNRRRSSVPLTSQILEDIGSISASGIAFSKFSDLDNRSSRVAITKVRGYVYCRGGTFSADDERFRFGLIKIPSSESVVVAGDFNDVQRNIYEVDCTCNRDDKTYETPVTAAYGIAENVPPRQ